MPTLIEEFGALLKQIRGVQVECGLMEMLVTLPTNEGRSQTVKVLCHRGTRGPYNVLRLVSRACVPRDHKVVHRAMRMNAGNELGGLALDSSSDPPVLDVVYNLIADSLDPNEFVSSVYRVAGLADRLEQRIEVRDEF